MAIRPPTFRPDAAAALAVVCLAVALVSVPAFFLLLGSFSTGSPADPERTFGLANYRSLLFAGETWVLLARTLGIGLATTAFTLGLGLPLAWCLARTDVPFRRPLEQLLVVPFFLSPFIGGIAWALLGAPRTGLLNLVLSSMAPSLFRPDTLDVYGTAGIVWTMSLYFVPFVFLFARSALENMDPALEEASQTCGASRFETARRVTLPLIRPAIAGSALLVFTLAVGQVGIPVLLGTPGRVHVLSTELFGLISSYPPRFGEAAAMGMLLFAVTALLVHLQQRALGGRRFVTVTGRGFRPRRLSVGRWRLPLLLLCLAYLLVSVALPLGALAWVSFLAHLVPSIDQAAYTLANYRDVLTTYPPTRLAIRNSLVLSVAGASAGMALTGVIAWILVRSRLRGRRLLEYASLFPAAVPAIVFALGLAWAWVGVPAVYGTLWLLLIAYVTVHLPYGVNASSAALRQIDPSLEECAAVCGGSRADVLWTITLPLARPGLVAGWVLMFIMFNRELATSLFLASSQSVVMSVAMYDLYYQGLWGRLSALALLQVVIVWALLAFGRWLGGGSRGLAPPLAG